MKDWDTDKLVVVGFLLIAAAMISLLLASGYSSAKFRDACLIAGGVPLQEHCIRPGAFMEVNP